MLQVDMENWVESARPLTQAEKERAFIIDNKVFEVLPRHGTLGAGEAQQVWWWQLALSTSRW
jgi:hypothetical protein